MIIFNVIQKEPWYVDAYRSVLGQIELYRRAWAIRQLVLADNQLLKAEWVLYLKEIASAEHSETVPAALRDLGSLKDARTSLLAAKPAYFDPELVASMSSDAGSNRSLTEFDAKIRERALYELRETSRWLKARDADERELNSMVEAFNERAKRENGFASEADFNRQRQRINERIKEFDTRTKSESSRLDRFFRRWTAPVPKIQHVSSIRERAFAPTLADCFVVEGANLPATLDFLIQITFETPPYFLKGEPPDPEDKAASEALAAYDDPEPWEFPALAARVRDMVRAGARRQARDGRRPGSDGRALGVHDPSAAVPGGSRRAPRQGLSRRIAGRAASRRRPGDARPPGSDAPLG